MPDTLTLTHLLGDLAKRVPNAPALLYREKQITYANLFEQSRHIACGLSDLGVGTGDRVALWLPNTPAWLACFFACARLGAIVLATNTRFRSAEMEDILGRAEAKVLIYWPAFRGIRFSAIVEELAQDAVHSLTALVAYAEAGDPDPPERVHGIPVYGLAALGERPALAEDKGNAEAGCLLFTTSGTTKAPKFALHQQQSIVRHALDVARAFGYLAPASRALGVLPFCGTYGFSSALAPLAAAAPIVVMSSFDAALTVERIRRHKLTNMNLSGDMLGPLLASASGCDAFASIRFCGCGSGCPQWIAPAAERGLRLSGVYGSSEVQALFSHHDALEAPFSDRALGGGWPVSTIAEVRVRDATSGASLAHGDSGALEIRAPSQMAEYFGDAKATRAAFTADGFVRTGDLGYTLPDGRFIFQARIGDALRLAGFLVNPAQIESVIAEHASVHACQVVGIDTERGARAYAFVTLVPGARFDEQSILAFARERMARYKVPERIVALDVFPTVQSANAIKIQKAKLREMATTINASGAPAVARQAKGR